MKSVLLRRAGGAALAACAIFYGPTLASAGPLPFMPEMNKYLVIATGQGTSGDEFTAFDMSNVEIGADQELVSNSDVGSPSQRVGSYTGGLDLTGTWVPNDGANAVSGGNRYNDVDPDHGGDTVGVPDRLPGARPVYEGIDYSGNVALTGSRAQFQSSNSDVNARIGIQCNRSPSSCFPNPSSNNSYFAGDADPVDPNAPGYNPNNDVEQNLNTLNGVSQFDPAALIGEMEATRDFIVGLAADTTFTPGTLASTTGNFTTNGIENTNIKDSGAPAITDLDAIDNAGNNDGIAVIDIDFEGVSFLVNNTDWILNTVEDTLVIFRMKEGNQFDFSDSSIVMGDCNLENDGTCDSGSSDDVIDELGAIFFMDADQGTNELFNLNNVILGGIALWDFTDFNPDRDDLLNPGDSVFNPPAGDETVVNLQDAQGCAQFISHQVLMSNNRWNRCAFADMGTTDVSEPSSLAIASLGLIGLGLARRRRQRAK